MTNRPGLRDRLTDLAGRVYLSNINKIPAPDTTVTVLNYHRISEGTFNNQLKYIRSRYDILHPELFLDWLNGVHDISKPSVLITFDDGYLSFYKEVYPILLKSKTPVLIFISTGFVNSNTGFWWDQVEELLSSSNTPTVVFGKKTFCLKKRGTDIHSHIFEHLRTLGEGERKKACESLSGQIKMTGHKSRDKKKYQLLDWPRIIEMERSGLVSIGSHTVNHPNLKTLSDSELKYEVHESKRELESRLGRVVWAFAYPYGDKNCFDGRAEDELNRAGYVCAFTTQQGVIGSRKENRYRLQRIMLFENQSEGAVALKMDLFGGAWRGIGKTLRRVF
jgi:peptidoglycan/xylan/chitin deacetylase (PgdA/CDA1 family)